MGYSEGIGEIIDKLSIANIKIFTIESEIALAMKEKPRNDKKIADLNDMRLKTVNRRRDLINELNKRFDPDAVEEIRVHS